MPIRSVPLQCDSLHFGDTVSPSVVSMVAVGKSGTAISFK